MYEYQIYHNKTVVNIIFKSGSWGLIVLVNDKMDKSSFYISTKSRSISTLSGGKPNG